MRSVVVIQAFIAYYTNAESLVYYNKKRSTNIVQQKTRQILPVSTMFILEEFYCSYRLYEQCAHENVSKHSKRIVLEVKHFHLSFSKINM